MAVFANRSANDLLRYALPELAKGSATVRLAAPFFSYSDIVKDLARDSSVLLIVRLGPATSPRALSEVLAHPRVQVRYFTGRVFHTKLYILGTRWAVVGSANLTDAGMHSNREASVSVPGNTDDFEELSALFEGYWSEAHVLDDNRLADYRRIYNELHDPSRDKELETAVIREFGQVQPSGGIQGDDLKPSAAKSYLEDYRRAYQAFAVAYSELKRIYVEEGIRRAPAIPLRIEIDQFVNYARDEHCIGDAYRDAPIRTEKERSDFARGLLQAWAVADFPYMYETIVPNYELITERLGSATAIERATPEELVGALEVCHAFKTRLRYFPGGLPTLRAAFLDQSPDRIRRSLIHLLHSDNQPVERMADLIFDPYYKLRECGGAVIQELLGWVNDEDVPICNGRTMKILQFLGHDLPTD